MSASESICLPCIFFLQYDLIASTLELVTVKKNEVSRIR